MDYKARSVILAKNWKKKRIEEILYIKNEMIKNNINEELINNYVDEEYKKIEERYGERIKKFLDNKDNNTNYSRQKKQKEIEFLLGNKRFLENQNVKMEVIEKYVNTEYEKINNKYSK